MKNNNNNNNNVWLILILVVLALVFFGGYGLVDFSGGIFNEYSNFGFMFAVLAFVCALLVIYDVLVNNNILSDGMKMLWVLLAIFFSIITAVIYFLIGRNSDNDLFKTSGSSR